MNRDGLNLMLRDLSLLGLLMQRVENLKILIELLEILSRILTLLLHRTCLLSLIRYSLGVNLSLVASDIFIVGDI
jgi:hypothetical protein